MLFGKKKKIDADEVKTPEQLEKMSPEEREEYEEAQSKANAHNANRAKLLCDHEDLMRFKAREKYIFHSDYFQIDDYYATIMTYVHLPGAKDNFGPFWGVNRIPTGLPTSIDAQVSTLNFEQITRMPDSWIAEHQGKAEQSAARTYYSQDIKSSNTDVNKAEKSMTDMKVIAQELNNGASYLHVVNRLMVKAKTLHALDRAVEVIEQQYLERFATLRVASYNGSQHDELKHLLGWNLSKRGKGFYYTSREYAGSYSLVTHGLEDKSGVYVGTMVDDVNTSTIMFDFDAFNKSAIVCSAQTDTKRAALSGYAHVADEWGSKIGQMALMNGHKVVHIILDNADMSKLGPAMSQITYKLDMSHGDINMFELFGKHGDEQRVFATHVNKLVLMNEQLMDGIDNMEPQARNALKSALVSVIEKFYIGKDMWRDDAQHHQKDLRLFIAHDEVPKLSAFTAWLSADYQRSLNTNDVYDQNATNTLKNSYSSLLKTNGDLFNTTTSDAIDGVSTGRRVIYDFSGLEQRGSNVAMAQLVNVIGFAIDNIAQGDVLIFHGAEHIREPVRKYLSDQMARLYMSGGRTVFLYNDFDAMFEQKSFSHFNDADYQIFGTMSPESLDRYSSMASVNIPSTLRDSISSKSSTQTFIHRGFSNVVFKRELFLDGYEAPRRHHFGRRKK